ncbi:MAG: inositol monophosphatase family protein, partial [Paludibacter sp.]
MTSLYQQLCVATCEIARNVGKFMANERESFDSSKIESKGLHDLVSYVDKESEKQIIEQLQILLPESGFIAEEGTNDIQGE